MLLLLLVVVERQVQGRTATHKILPLLHSILEVLRLLCQRLERREKTTDGIDKRVLGIDQFILLLKLQRVLLVYDSKFCLDQRYSPL